MSRIIAESCRFAASRDLDVMRTLKRRTQRSVDSMHPYFSNQPNMFQRNSFL